MTDRQRMLELALKGLQAERTTIDDEISEIKSQLGLHPTVSTGAAPKRRTMSAAARKRISQGMKRRYAAMRSLVPDQSVKEKPNSGSGLTEAGRKRLSDLMKKRWAERRRSKAK